MPGASFELMKRRKALLRKASETQNKKEATRLKAEARRLLVRAEKAGGLTAEEAQAVALL